METIKRSDVRSKLARKEALSGQQCSSLYIYRGQTFRCNRPASGHRVHQGAYVQWVRSNVK